MAGVVQKLAQDVPCSKCLPLAVLVRVYNCGSQLHEYTQKLHIAYYLTSLKNSAFDNKLRTIKKMRLKILKKIRTARTESLFLLLDFKT